MFVWVIVYEVVFMLVVLVGCAACWQREDNPPCAEFNQHENAEFLKKVSESAATRLESRNFTTPIRRPDRGNRAIWTVLGHLRGQFHARR